MGVYAGTGRRMWRPGGTGRAGKLGRVGDCIGDCLCLLWEKERQGEDYDSGFGPHYGESWEEWGEIGRGGRWPDGEHIPIATRHPPNQSPP